jgi:2,4-dienoyl-CoA reductase-like NADH-dependent reductase (Old Yellow Enzyme family)
MTEHTDTRPALTSELHLGNGVTLPNRIAKAATSEHLATRHGAPTRQLTEVYRQLAGTGAGLLISGNVMVDGSALEAHRNVVIEDERFLPALRDWAAATAGTDTKFILQLSHPGRQTMRGLSVAGRRQDVVSASAVPLAISGASRRMFTPPRALTEAEILALIDRFGTAARVAASAGFDGVELHAAHGYLFSQFLSPLVNQRQDRWGGSLENRMRLLLDTVRAVRAATPESFLLAVKLNSADFQRGGFDAEDALTVAKALQAEGVGLIEVSGGTYENAAMISGSPKRASTAAREAYFLEFAERFARELTVPIMLSGGFRTRQGMIEALRGGAVDLIGLARPLAHEPDLAQRLLAGTADTSLVRRHAVGHRVVDDLIDGLWHQQQMARLGRGRPLRPERSAAVALAVVLLTGARDALLHRLPV